ncbi:MAG: cupin domain-containing protein [Actinomycetota bacterium]|nr:cupin domain-containing protein [Actinomycetota bacterium]
MDRPNIFEASFEYDEDDPAGYRGGVAQVGKLAGGKELHVKLYELRPGEALCPYHYEYEEEWLIVLVGSLVLRDPDGEHELRHGDVVCFPPGPAGAHNVTNRAEAASRILMFSSAREPAVAVYPDSDKMGVWPGNPDDSRMFHRADGNVDYYEGEV